MTAVLFINKRIKLGAMKSVPIVGGLANRDRLRERARYIQSYALRRAQAAVGGSRRLLCDLGWVQERLTGRERQVDRCVESSRRPVH